MRNVLPDFKTISLERSGRVLVATIDNPASEINAVDDVLHSEFGEFFAWLKDEDEARAVLLTHSGKAFSAGGDFAWFPSLQSPEKLEELRRHAKRMIWDLLDVEVPIVCALDGPAVGLGASIVLFTDTVFMSERAKLADPHVGVGLVAGDGGAAIWPLLVGPLRAKRFLLTGDAVSPAEALDLGLANFVEPGERLRESAMAFAERLADGAPLAIRYTKLSVNKLIKDALNIAFDTSTALEIRTFLSEDHREALAAIREKRKPDFKGR
jgi:enoyl-CoA hydratase